MSRKHDVVTLSGDEVDDMRDTIETLTAERDWLRAELADATEYARNIVTWLHRDHYAEAADFEPFADLPGLLSQIDNMICGWKPQYATCQPAGTDGLVDTLRKFNAWRQGDDTVAAPDPRAITAAIESACCGLEEHAARLAELAKLRAQEPVAWNVSIPTRIMEQEFQNHYRRGFDAGKKSAAPVPARVPDDVARDAAVGAAIERAARLLPRYYSIYVEVESGAATVRLYDDECCRLGYDSDGDTLAGEINTAINTALSAAQKGE